MLMLNEVVSACFEKYIKETQLVWSIELRNLDTVRPGDFIKLAEFAEFRDKYRAGELLKDVYDQGWVYRTKLEVWLRDVSEWAYSMAGMLEDSDEGEARSYQAWHFEVQNLIHQLFGTRGNHHEQR